MKNLSKKLLACCLAICMVLTLCVGALTVSADVTDNYVEVGSVEVTTEENAVVPVSILSTGGIAAAEINVSVPDLTISKLELVTTDTNVYVTYASKADPTGALISLDKVAGYASEVAPNVIDNVFTYIVHLPANTVTTAEVTLNITFGTLAVGTYDIAVDTESCKDATSDLLTLEEIDGAIVVKEAHVCEDVYTNNGDNHTITCANGCDKNITEEHTYVEGTCVCGAVEVTECQHVHNAAPIAASPAQEDGTQGSITFNCEVCGKDITYPVEYRRASSSPENPSLVLDSTTLMGVTLKISNAGDSNKGYFAYTHNYVNGAESTFHAFSLSEAENDGSNYKWSIPAYYSQFSDEFVSAMYTYNEGQWTNGYTRIFSVKKAGMTFVKSTTQPDTVKRVAANLLKTGAATMSEFVKNVSADKYPDVELVGEYAQYVTTTNPSVVRDETNYIVNQSNASVDGMCGFVTSVLLGESVQMKLGLNPKYYPAYSENGISALSNMVLSYSYTTYQGAEVSGTIPDFNFDSSTNRMEFIFALASPNLRCPVKFQLLDNGVPASYEVTYSIESLLYSSLSAYPNTINALMNYSDSVRDM